MHIQARIGTMQRPRVCPNDLRGNGRDHGEQTVRQTNARDTCTNLPLPQYKDS